MKQIDIIQPLKDKTDQKLLSFEDQRILPADALRHELQCWLFIELPDT